MIGIAATLGKMALDGVTGYFKAKGERKKIKLQSENKINEAKTEATINRIKSGDNAAINMDALSIQDRGWKDEYLLFIATLPLIASFIPPLVSYVEAGFRALDTMPDWYMWVLLGVYVDTFGFRRILRNVLESVIAKKFS